MSLGHLYGLSQSFFPMYFTEDDVAFLWGYEDS